MVDINFLREKIDFTNVSPLASMKEIDEFCKNALAYKVKTIYVQPFFLQHIKDIIKNEIDIGTTGGFPFGNIPLQIKFKEIEYAAHNGARWIDICLNLSNVKSGYWNEVRNEIINLKDKSVKEGIGLKIIIETPFLTNKEIEEIIKISETAEIEFIKTASGVRNKVTLDQLKFIKPLLKYCKIKVAGRITKLGEVEDFLKNGADKIGSSNGFEILEEALRNGNSTNSTCKI